MYQFIVLYHGTYNGFNALGNIKPVSEENIQAFRTQCIAHLFTPPPPNTTSLESGTKFYCY